jgi:molybdopterin molybdotransferase
MNKQNLLTLDEALSQLLVHAIPDDQGEQVSILRADNRVLANDVVSEISVPSFDNSAMDGYAFCFDDWVKQNGVFQLGQRIPAGHSPQPLRAGHADRIFTGAPLPAGADTVVMQEECEVISEHQIKILSQPQRGQCVRSRGEDITLGDKVLLRGTRLTPASLGLIASLGLAHVNVISRPRVALFSTGDELIMPGSLKPSELPSGAIFNSNRFFLKALLERLGCVVTDAGILPDQLDATRSALAQAAQQHDLLLTSGGVSVGEEDHVKPAVQSLGQLHLWSLSIKPGKPFAYGQIHQEGNQSVHFIGLPGNPVSSLVTFILLVRPFILKLQGSSHTQLKTYDLRADFAWTKQDKRREFLRVKCNDAGGLDLFSNQSSGVLTSAVWGDGLVDNPAGNVIQPGDIVKFISFTDCIS